MDRILILVADDDPSIRRVLAALIGGDDGMELVGTAEDADQAIAIAETSHPDVALLDVKMPGGGPHAACQIRLRSPATRVVAFSAHEDEDSVNEMLAEGATSYVVKGTPASDILQAIRRSFEGGTILSGEVAGHVVSELSTRLERERREKERREAWGGRVRRILSGEDQITMVFQPIVELDTGRVVGVEALARFPGEPVRSADVWFAEAAYLGLGTQLEEAAVRAAVRSLDDLPPDVFLAVNASPETVVSAQLRDALLGIPLERIVLEVTEHAPVADYPRLRDALGALKGQGARLAIDDAGAGYASLRHILHLGPDFIKLDITLTRGIETEKPQQALAAALVTFAQRIGATITAEGIETAAELAALKDLSVSLGQGFYLGRPGALPQGWVVPGLVTGPRLAVAG